MTVGQQDNSFHVLYADQNAARRQRVARTLAAEYDVETVESLSAATATSGQADCLACATDLPGSEMQGLLDLGDEWGVPVVVLSSTHRSDSNETTRTDPVDDEAVASLLQRIEAVERRTTSDITDVVLDASKSLMGAAPDEVDTKIEWELKTVGKRLDATRCAFYRVDADGEALERTHAWSADQADDDVTVSTDQFPGFDRRLRRFESVVIPSSAEEADEPSSEQSASTLDVPDGFVGDVDDVLGGDGGTAVAGGTAEIGDPADGLPPYVEEAGFEAFCAVPVVIDWDVYGVLEVGRDHGEHWSEDLERQLKLFGEFVGHSLRRRRRRRELERKNDRLERFASVVSHDLQNPINVIEGYAELVLEGGDRDHLRDVLESAGRMERLIDDLLALSKEGAAVGEIEPVSIDAVATDAWQTVDTPEAQLRTDVDDRLEADPGRLQQALENLFKNALEHGGEDVTVRVVSTDGGFAVEDDGPGIPDAHRDEIFQEGYTGSDGTGLGLSIVESIVDAHGWSIAIAESDTGGARFEVVTE